MSNQLQYSTTTTSSDNYHPSNPEVFEFTILNRKYAAWRPTRNTWMVYAFRTGATIWFNHVDDMLNWIEGLTERIYRKAQQRELVRAIRNDKKVYDAEINNTPIWIWHSRVTLPVFGMVA